MDQLIRENLRKAVLCKQKEKRVILAQGVLVEKHRVGFITDLSLPIIFDRFLFFKLLVADDLFVVEVDVEQDLSRVLLQ